LLVAGERAGADVLEVHPTGSLRVWELVSLQAWPMVDLIQSASGGTPFLEEIGDPAFELQPQPLRVFREARGAPQRRQARNKVDIRVIAATNRPHTIGSSSAKARTSSPSADANLADACGRAHDCTIVDHETAGVRVDADAAHPAAAATGRGHLALPVVRRFVTGGAVAAVTCS
jgi:hypothetical protein